MILFDATYLPPYNLVITLVLIVYITLLSNLVSNYFKLNPNPEMNFVLNKSLILIFISIVLSLLSNFEIYYEGWRKV